MSHIDPRPLPGAASGARRLGTSVFLALSLVVPAARADAAIRREAVLRVEVTPLVVEGGATRSLETLTVEATRGEPGVLDAPLDWMPAGAGADLTFTVSFGDDPGEQGHALSLSAVVRIPGLQPVRSARTMTLAEGSTGLFEVLALGDRRLVLSLRAEESARAVVGGPRKVGAPVLFLLEIERREGSRTIPLETNRLVTLLLEGVEYSFSSGEGSLRESLRVVLTPLSLEGDVAEVEVDVTGSLPGTGGPLLLSRRERLLTSRGATSSMEATTGDPPSGYRFRITPHF